jgi:hypothetical protein
MSAKSFPLSELTDATSNWSASAILGKGGFAVVFLGVLRIEGRVAIKRVQMPKDEKERKFVEVSTKGEMETMYNYNHENICELLGTYLDAQKPDVYCLVYELCENGSLLERLECRDHKNNPVPALTAEQRLLIALGTCRALEYLHVYALPVGLLLLRNAFTMDHYNFLLPADCASGRQERKHPLGCEYASQAG